LNATTRILLTPSSPLWPAIFEYERSQLAGLLGEGASIEHIGSTAVAGLGAKPVIDILVGATSLEAIEARIPALEAYGYRYVREFERGMPQRRYFTRTDGHPGHFHLHAVVHGSAFWTSHLAFRDALRADPKLAADYWKLKQRLAARFPDDRAAYTDGKGEFIRAVLARKA
jgi:GrpB-like predicted nucleotidyltransferase (UPF0157 family)